MPASYITRNLPKTLEFYVPDSLVSGQSNYLELVSQATTGMVLLKEPRTTQSPVELTVA